MKLKYLSIDEVRVEIRKGKYLYFYWYLVSCLGLIKRI